MQARSRPLLIALLVLVLAGIGASVWVVLQSDSAQTEAATAQKTPTVQGTARTDPAKVIERDALVGKEVAPQPSANTTSSTVAWPLKVALDLVADGTLPQAEGVPLLGSGRTATLSGTVVRNDQAGVAVTVTFVHGMNEGRVLQANSSGAFGASDLYPGLSIVRVDGPQIAGSTREVLLRQGKETLLNLSYDFPANVWGTVYEQSTGKALADVDVELDGQHTTTNEAGEFNFPQMTAGDKLLLILKKKGFASYREIIGVAHGLMVPHDRYKFNLTRSGALRFFANAMPGDASEATVLLANALAYGSHGEFAGARVYPWHLVNPLRVSRTQPAVVDDLPEGDVDIRAFATGALGSPAVNKVSVRAGETVDVALRFDALPMLTGKVVRSDGAPVEGAWVELEAPDRTIATLNWIGVGAPFLETEVLPTMPVALQRAHSAFDGSFSFSAADRWAPVRYCRAQTTDGKFEALAVVKSSDTTVELTLKPKASSVAKLSVLFPGRFQGLPITSTINGVPFPEQTIGSNDPLVFENLSIGTWRISASWNGDAVVPSPALIKLDRDASYTLNLPKGAIDGQDEDTRRRAGRL